MKVTILEPKGYCAGVANAISLAINVRKDNPDKDIYVLGMLVHNDEVISMLNEYQITTIHPANKDNLLTIPDNSIIIFTAHGHDISFDEIAKEKNLTVYDAVCFKVKHNLTLIKDYLSQGHEVIFIGSKNHPETNAALSLGKGVYLFDICNKNTLKINDENPLIINQTTLSLLDIKSAYDELRKAFKNPIFQDEICNVTRCRQESIMNLGHDIDAIVVVGDKKSSNTRKLFEIAKEYHPNAYICLVSSIEDLDKSALVNKKHVAVTSGTSTPVETINMISNCLKNY